jgi:hypothetical protein
MEAIRDIDHHMLCTADPDSGTLEHKSRGETITIHLLPGCDVAFRKKESYTVIRRESPSSLNVYSTHLTAPD